MSGISFTLLSHFGAVAFSKAKVYLSIKATLPFFLKISMFLRPDKLSPD